MLPKAVAATTPAYSRNAKVRTKTFDHHGSLVGTRVLSKPKSMDSGGIVGLSRLGSWLFIAAGGQRRAVNDMAVHTLVPGVLRRSWGESASHLGGQSWRTGIFNAAMGHL